MPAPNAQTIEIRRILSDAKNAATGRRTAQSAAFRSMANAQPVSTEPNEVRQQALASPAYRDAWRHYTLRGEQSLNLEQRHALAFGEQRDLSDLTAGSGGYTVPPALEARLSAAQLFASPVRSVATVLSTPDGRAISWPSTDDTGQVATMLGENVQATSADPTFSRITLKSYPFVVMLKAPRALEADVRSTFSTQGQYVAGNQGFRTPTPTSGYPNPAAPTEYTAISIEDVIVSLAAPRIARAFNPFATAGTGSGQPLGITHATVGATTASPTAITYADLQSAWAAVDESYRPTSTWMFNAATEKAIRALVDAGNRLIFDPSAPLTIFGQPVVLNRDMPSIAASAVSVVVGDFKRGVVMRTVQGVTMQRLQERFMDNLELGWVLAERLDSTLDDLSALKALVCHA